MGASVNALAAAQQLGAYRESHRTTNTLVPVLLFLLGAIALGGGGAFAIGEGANVVGLVLLGVAALALAVGARAAVDMLREPVVMFFEFDGGLVRGSKRGEEAFAWSGVDVFEKHVRVIGSYGGTKRIERRVMLRRPDGEEILHKDIDDFGQRMIDKVNTAHMQQTNERLQAGETVSFGRLGVSLQGLTVNGKTQPWANIRRCSLGNGTIDFYTGSRFFRWAKQPLEQTPNLRVLLALANALIPRQRQPAADQISEA